MTNNTNAIAEILQAMQQQPNKVAEFLVQNPAVVKSLGAVLCVRSEVSDIDVLETTRQEGFRNGLQQAIIAYGHNLRTLSLGISGHQLKWMFPKEYVPRFEASGVNYYVTPVPELLNALGRTISFWSLGSDFNPLGMSDQEFPKNLADVIYLACGFADSARLASHYARTDMSDATELSNFAREQGMATKVGFLSEWRINEDVFSIGDTLDTKRFPFHRLYMRQLGGVIRMISAVASDMTGRSYAKEWGCKPVMFVSATAVTGNRVKIVVSSVDNPAISYQTSESQDSLAAAVGMNTTQLLKFLSDGFLSDLNPSVNEPLITEGRYSACFEFDLPKWLIAPT